MNKFKIWLKNEFVNGWSLFNYLFVIIVLLVQGISIYLGYQRNPSNNFTLIFQIIRNIAMVGTIILTAKGKISLYFFGFIMNICILYASLKAGFYIDTFEKLCIIGFMIYGAFSWKNKYKSTENFGNLIQSKKFTCKHWIILAIILITIPYPLGILSTYIFNNPIDLGFIQLRTANQQITDGFTLVFELLAMILMTRRFKEQWLFHLLYNIFALKMWSFYQQDLSMISMHILRIFNIFYGWHNWNKLAKNNIMRN
jgi:nicotinamide mononucleotide transporter PnuC